MTILQNNSHCTLLATDVKISTFNRSFLLPDLLKRLRVGLRFSHISDNHFAVVFLVYVLHFQPQYPKREKSDRADFVRELKHGSLEELHLCPI